MTRRVGQLLVAMSAAALCACGQFQDGPKPDEGLFAPVLNPITPVNMSLRTLPPPERRVAVAVYGYTDQTGQFKPAEAVQQLSRAVTQGATIVLIKALQDAGDGSWFTVVERERLENLLKERRIITDMRMRYLNEKTVNAQALPPLLFAGILLEGGIIGFDSNTRTGGIGARYLGIGGDIKYKEDTVTIYLRAISTKTGEVLVSTVSHKTVCSYGIQGGAFKFVSIDEILEAEAGITRNEPEQLAVQQAIEKAVHAMIVEGSARGLWAFANKAYQQDLIYRYDAEQASYRHAQAKTPAGPTYAAGAPAAERGAHGDRERAVADHDCGEHARTEHAGAERASRERGAMARTTGDAHAAAAGAGRSHAAAAPRPPSQPLPPPVAEAVKREAQEIAALQSAQAAFSRGEPPPGVLPEAGKQSPDAPQAKVSRRRARRRRPRQKSAAKAEHEAVQKRRAGGAQARMVFEDAKARRRREARKQILRRALSRRRASEDLRGALGEGEAPRSTVAAWRKTRAGRTSTSAARRRRRSRRAPSARREVRGQVLGIRF